MEVLGLNGSLPEIPEMTGILHLSRWGFGFDPGTMLLTFSNIGRNGPRTWPIHVLY